MLDEYYRSCAFPKVPQKAAKPKDTQAGQRRAERKQTDKADALANRAAGRQVRQDLFRHWRYRCAAEGVSPVCTGRAKDPHELIRRSLGGEVSLENSVPVCRECHHEADAKVGGNRLTFDWVGKADGKLPQAHLRGNVWAVWTARKGKRR